MPSVIQSLVASCWFGAEPAMSVYSAVNGGPVHRTHAEAVDFDAAVQYARRAGLPGLLALDRLWLRNDDRRRRRYRRRR